MITEHLENIKKYIYENKNHPFFPHQGNIDCEYLGIYSSILFLCMYNWYTLENKLYKYILYLILYPIFHNTVAYSYVMKYSLETKFVNTAS